MWQSSAVDGGKEARDERTWAPNSLVRVLVDQTLRRCLQVSAKAEQRQEQRKLVEIIFQSSYYTLEERIALTTVSCDIAKQWPECELISKQRVLLKSLLRAPCVAEVMRLADMERMFRYSLRTQAMISIEKMKAENMLHAPHPSMMTTDRKCLAFALFLSVAGLALDSASERVFRGLIQDQAYNNGDQQHMELWTKWFLEWRSAKNVC